MDANQTYRITGAPTTTGKRGFEVTAVAGWPPPSVMTLALRCLK